MVSPPALPLTPLDFPIILDVTDGVADTTLAHLPAETLTSNGPGGSQIRWADFEAPPVSWQSACGDVYGWVYNRAGALADIEICVGCEIAAA